MVSEPLIVICGPTASRKSELAMAMAEQLNGELICCDSVQVYQGFQIGSAGPNEADRERVPHHLFYHYAPTDPADAGRYARDADTVIADIVARGKRPILVGGTGLYLRALLWGLAEVPAVSAEIKAKLQADLAEIGNAGLFQRLLHVDDGTASRLDGGVADTQRILRALEVFEATGRPLSAYHAEHTPAPRYKWVMLAPTFEREVLSRRIERRVDRLLEAGLVQEVRDLLAAGVPRDCRPMGALGYKEALQYLDGGLSDHQLPERIARGHRRYAKRQRTWFKKEPDVVTLDGSRDDLLEQALAAL